MNKSGVVTRGGVTAVIVTVVIGLGLADWSAHAVQDRPPIDFEKAKAIFERARKGERVTKEEQAYVERAKAEFARKKAAYPKVPGKPSVGITPLTDLASDARYKEQDGGLHGGGKNAPPDALLKTALAAGKEIRPLDAAGAPSPSGKVVLLSIGMSNTTQEYRQFMVVASRDGEKAPWVVPIDGAQGGMTAFAWANPDRVKAGGRPDPWAVLDQRLETAGVTAKQVQVVWLKQANANPAPDGDFPGHAEKLKQDIAGLLAKLRKRFPNLKLVYLSSRIYAGYAATPLNPEPYAYESAFAVRWLIRDQLDGSTLKQPEQRPVLLWGPYLWADGEKGRKTDKLVYLRKDLGPDGTHPSPSGQQKVAEMLLRFFKTDPTAKGWFLKSTATDAR